MILITGFLIILSSFSPSLAQAAPVDSTLSQVYKAVPLFNHLSYLSAKMADLDRSPSEIEMIQEDLKELTHRLSRNWQIDFFKGMNGANNIQPDSAGVIALNKKKNVITIAFHGSRNRWDWSSNLDFTPVSGQSLGLKMPHDVYVHRGFANNYKSSQSALFKKLKRLMLLLPQSERAHTKIIVTGHSKGAAIASIAIPSLTQFFKENYGGIRFNNTKSRTIIGVFFSAPRAYLGQSAVNWLHGLVGKNNIYQINVKGDPVPAALLKPYLDYRSIGVLVLDTIEKVHERELEYYRKSVHWFNWLAGYHYISNGLNPKTEDLAFDPHIVPSIHEFPTLIKAGNLIQVSYNE